jgi:hypothetical protein
MSESPPPPWGPASYDERDLDALLSGEAAGIPDALRPVADTLAALRSAPQCTELAGEAAARAAFRAFTVAGESGPGWTPGSAGTAGSDGTAGSCGSAISAGAAGPAVDGHLPVLSVVNGNGGPHALARRRHATTGLWRAVAMVGTAAAAVIIVGAVAIAGIFSSPAGHKGPATRSNSSRTGSAAGSSLSSSGSAPHVYGHGTTETARPKPKPKPTATPQPTAIAPQPSDTPGQGYGQAGGGQYGDRGNGHGQWPGGPGGPGWPGHGHGGGGGHGHGGR